MIGVYSVMTMMNKVYCLYLNNRLYAHSQFQDRVNSFLEERNSSKFKLKEFKVGDIKKLPLSSELTTMILNDGEKSFSVVVTYEENKKFNESFETIIRFYERYLCVFRQQNWLDENIKKLLIDILDITTDTEICVSADLHINEIRLFTELFSKTL